MDGDCVVFGRHMDGQPVVSVVVVMVGDEAGRELARFVSGLISYPNPKHSSSVVGSRLTEFSIVPSSLSSFQSSTAYRNFNMIHGKLLRLLLTTGMSVVYVLNAK
jgi:hypothetical protein